MPMSKPITYVIATFNEEKNISLFLESITPYIAKYVHFLFQDNQSSDETLPIVLDFKKNNPNVSIDINSEPDNGIYNAWNKAISTCSSPWIGFIGADDKFLDNTHPFDFLEKSEKFNFVTFSGIYASKIYGKPLPRDLSLNKFIFGWKIMHQGSLYRAAILNRYPFDTRYEICGDFAHFLTIRSFVKSFHNNAPLLQIGTSGLSSVYYNRVACESSLAFFRIKPFTWRNILYSFIILFFILGYSALNSSLQNESSST